MHSPPGKLLNNYLQTSTNYPDYTFFGQSTVLTYVKTDFPIVLHYYHVNKKDIVNNGCSIALLAKQSFCLQSDR